MNRDHSHPEIVDLLLTGTEHSVTHIQTSNGNTCLHWLLSQKYPRNQNDLKILEKVFFSCPSAVFVKNKDKKTPMEMLISTVASSESNLLNPVNQPQKFVGNEELFDASFVLGHLLELVNNYNHQTS